MVNKGGGRFQTYRNFQVTPKDSNYLMLVTKYFDNVQDKIFDLLQSDKKMSSDKAEKFLDNMMMIDKGRSLDIKEEIKDYYGQGMSTKDAAKALIKKYYGITKINKYDNSSAQQEEETEVNEKATTSFYHWKHVSSSLFWNFINRVNKLDVKFIFDTSYINKLDNSLNHSEFALYMETEKVNDKAVENEFMYSKLLSNILKVLTSNKYDGDGIKFFIGIDKNVQLRFGYIMNNKRYTIGGFSYKSSDISKLAPSIKASNGDIDFKKLSIKFKSSLQNMWYYRSVLTVYLEQYGNINIYRSVINDKLALVIESSENDDVINKTYIERILQDNIGERLKKENFYVNDMQFQGKTHYYIIIK